MSQLLTPQGQPIVGASLTVSLLDGSLLAEVTSADAFNDDGPADREAISRSGHVATTFLARPPASALCQLKASGGEIVMVHKGEALRLENDTVPENIVPCRVLDRGNLPPETAQQGVSINEITTTVLDTIRLYTALDSPDIDLAGTLDAIATGLLGSSPADLDGDGAITYADFSLLPAEAHRSLGIDRVIEAVQAVMAAPSSKRALNRPNIILIVADDLGYGDVSAFWPTGGINTPNIDRIAASGAKFTNFHVQPVCAATRISLLTGRFHRQLAIGGAGGPARAGIPRWAETMPETLRQAGYRTAAFGKWHLSYRRGFLPPDRGFQKWLGFYGGSSPYSLEDINARSQRFLFEDFEPYVQRSGHTTDLFADRAMDFIQQNRGQPFFVYLAFNAPHTPIWGEQNRVFSSRPDWLKTVQSEGLIGAQRQDYAAIVRHMDARIGDILDQLESLELTRDTILVFLSDNGAEVDSSLPVSQGAGSNGPFRGGKSSVYEGGTRVPMIMQWPATFPRGITVDQFTMMVDIWPTLRDILNLPEQSQGERVPIQGDSLVPLLTGAAIADEGWSREGVFLFPLTGLALHSPPWKLIRDANGQEELYNLSEDPSERLPLNQSHPGILQSMSKRVDQHLVGDP